jgi:hypothetical protein
MKLRLEEKPLEGGHVAVWVLGPVRQDHCRLYSRLEYDVLDNRDVARRVRSITIKAAARALLREVEE